MEKSGSKTLTLYRLQTNKGKLMKNMWKKFAEENNLSPVDFSAEIITTCVSVILMQMDTKNTNEFEITMDSENNGDGNITLTCKRIPRTKQ